MIKEITVQLCTRYFFQTVNNIWSVCHIPMYL